VYANYGAKGRSGWGSIDLTIVGANGKLLRCWQRRCHKAVDSIAAY
jgi:hypothetical protein